MNDELLRFNPLPADLTNHHDIFRHQPHEQLPTGPADTSYRRPSQEQPAPNTHPAAGFRGVLPQPFYSGESAAHTTQHSRPQQESHSHTPQQPHAYDTEYQAIESDSDDDALMPRRRPAVNDSPVDLTQSPNTVTASASQQSRTRKRSSTSNGEGAGSAKKRTKRTSMSTARVDAEDLQDEAPSAEDELLQAQHREALKMQETNKDEGAVKIGQRTCIICLENYTNATTAICGKVM